MATPAPVARAVTTVRADTVAGTGTTVAVRRVLVETERETGVATVSGRAVRTAAVPPGGASAPPAASGRAAVPVVPTVVAGRAPTTATSVAATPGEGTDGATSADLRHVPTATPVGTAIVTRAAARPGAATRAVMRRVGVTSRSGADAGLTENGPVAGTGLRMVARPVGRTTAPVTRVRTADPTVPGETGRVAPGTSGTTAGTGAKAPRRSVVTTGVTSAATIAVSVTGDRRARAVVPTSGAAAQVRSDPDRAVTTAVTTGATVRTAGDAVMGPTEVRTSGARTSAVDMTGAATVGTVAGRAIATAPRSAPRAAPTARATPTPCCPRA